MNSIELENKYQSLLDHIEKIKTDIYNKCLKTYGY